MELENDAVGAWWVVWEVADDWQLRANCYYLLERCKQKQQQIESMYFQDEVQLPALIPIRAKKVKKEDNTQKEDLSNDVLKILTTAFDKQKESNDAKKVEKQTKPTPGAEKVQELDRRFMNLQEKGSSKKEDKSAQPINHKQRQNQKSKHIITDMMKKIDAKNIAEQLYPVTNETVLGFIKDVEREIVELKVEAERKENHLVTNPNNQHLKRELEVIKVSIDRCVTIKELYNEKLNLRNKVSILQKSIITLKGENENLRIKNYLDLEDQENHSNNLPCYKERELKEELTKSQAELKKEKAMREKLENNINDIVQNFKRLYEEADTARIIVTKKLKEIQEKEKALAFQKSLNDSEQDAKSQINKIPQKLETADGKKIRNSHQNQGDFSKTMRKPTNPADSRGRQQQKANQKQLTLQEQIVKMRGNQSTMAKSHQRR